MINWFFARQKTPYTKTSCRYRPNIDGLRGIAVLSVIGFHAFPTLIKGGFVGVDVFFVISGFLISTIIYDGLEHNNFSFLAFYNRRIRRIFPALIVVLLASYIFGWFSLTDNEYKQLGKHIAAGASFVLNIVLWKESGYFDTATAAKPLMHLWSLGIEEQFYLFWPAFLWIFWKRKFSLLNVTFVLAIVSFILNIMFIRKYTIATFYLPQARFWELMAGSLLAWVMLHGSKSLHYIKCKISGRISICVSESENNATILSNVLSFVGMILIIFSIFIIKKESLFPGYWALMPVFGTVLIIASGNRSWINLIISNRLFVWFGLISYPLYLWHWPMLSFTHNILGSYVINSNVSRVIRFCCVCSAVVLAWVTYELIEKPIRFGVYRRNKVTLGLLITTIIIMGYVGYDCYRRNGLTFRYITSPNDYSVRNNFTYKNIPIDCNNLIQNTNGISCLSAEHPKIALIGDSHAGPIFYGMFNNGIDESYKHVIGLSAGGCQPILGSESYFGCSKKVQRMVDVIKNNKEIKTVIIVGYYGYVNNVTSEASLVGYQNIINALQRPWRKIVFVVDNPSLKQSAEACQPEPLIIKKFFRKILYKNQYSFCQKITMNDWCDQSEYISVINRLKKSNPEIVFFDSKHSLCDKENCFLFKKSYLLYGDFNHLSVYGSELVANDLINKLIKTK